MQRKASAIIIFSIQTLTPHHMLVDNMFFTFDFVKGNVSTASGYYTTKFKEKIVG